jgi:anthranilate/para-aminobenzoate synthase component II
MFNQITGPLHVCRYQSLILTEIEGKNLVDLAYTQKNELMALAHASLPIWAVQFHPEAILTSHGLTIIDNWLSSFTLHSTKLARM